MKTPLNPGQGGLPVLLVTRIFQKFTLLTDVSSDYAATLVSLQPQTGPINVKDCIPHCGVPAGNSKLQREDESACSIDAPRALSGWVLRQSPSQIVRPRKWGMRELRVITW